MKVNDGTHYLHFDDLKKKKTILVVQWLRICLATWRM